MFDDLAMNTLPLVLSHSVDVRAPVPGRFVLIRGESATLSISLLQGGEPFPIPEGVSARFYYQTSEMNPGNQWYYADAWIEESTVYANWTLERDSGANAYSGFFQLAPPSGSWYIYRAACSIIIKPGPGIPNELPLPVPRIDFSKIEVLNAPWATAAYVSAVAAAASEAKDAASAARTVACNHAARRDNPHEVTAAQVGALPITGGSLTGPVGMQVLLAAGSIPAIGEAEPVRNIVLVTTPDGEAPAVWLSGLAAGLEEGAAALLTVIFQNTGNDPATFTIARDDASSAIWRGLIHSDEHNFYVSALSPGAFAFCTLLVWRRTGGATPLFLLRDFFRSDNLNIYNTMDPILYSPSGKVFHLVVDDEGGLSTQFIT